MKIEGTELLDVLMKVKPGLSSNEIIEQSMHFCFQDGVVRTYNDQIAISCPFDSDITGAVSANEFFSLIEKLSPEDIELTVKGDELKVRGGKTKAMIKMSPDIKLIDIDIDGIKRWHKLPDDFLEVIKFCLFSASTNLADSEFTCLYVSGDRVLSCDTFRATEMTMDGEVFKEFMLPAKAVRELIKYEELKTYALNDNWLHFKDRWGAIFSCRVVAFGENRLKDVSSFFKVKGKKVQLPSDFKNIVDRAQTLTVEAFEQERSVELEIAEGKITVRGESDMGYVEESVKTNYKGRGINVNVHPECLMQILEHLNDVVIGESTLLFEGDNFKHVVKLQAGE